MSQLEEITIKVPQPIAEAYKQADEIGKQAIIDKIEFFLQPISIDKQTAIQKLNQTMNKIAIAAQHAGLTQEILENILDDK